MLIHQRRFEKIWQVGAQRGLWCSVFRAPCACVAVGSQGLCLELQLPDVLIVMPYHDDKNMAPVNRFGMIRG